MAADLYIHVFEGITEEDLANFFAGIMGSKYFSLVGYDSQKYMEASDKIQNTPAVWIGEVSWLKAALTEDEKKYVPSTVGAVEEAIGEDLPVLDDSLIERILAAFKLKNKTNYRLANPREVKRFLQKHKGKKVFTVSW
jgi:hypothetical protein